MSLTGFFPEKGIHMDSKGYSTVETALTFPLLLMLIIVLLFVLVTFVVPKNKEPENTEAFIDRIHFTDSIKRKAEIISDIFK